MKGLYIAAWVRTSHKIEEIYKALSPYRRVNYSKDGDHQVIYFTGDEEQGIEVLKYLISIGECDARVHNT